MSGHATSEASLLSRIHLVQLTNLCTVYDIICAPPSRSSPDKTGLNPAFRFNRRPFGHIAAPISKTVAKFATLP